MHYAYYCWNNCFYKVYCLYFALYMKQIRSRKMSFQNFPCKMKQAWKIIGILAWSLHWSSFSFIYCKYACVDVSQSEQEELLDFTVNKHGWFSLGVKMLLLWWSHIAYFQGVALFCKKHSTLIMKRISTKSFFAPLQKFYL